MRKEVKIAMVLVLIGIVVSAIYFFSSSEKTVEIKPPKPLSPAVVSSNENIQPITAAPQAVEPVSKAPTAVEPEKQEVKKDTSKPIWTINLEPLNGAPTSRPVVRQTVASHEKKRAEIESAANKVIDHKPVKLTELEPLGGAVVSADKKNDQVLTAGNTEVEPIAKETTHVVKAGETLYQIAKTYYGDGTKWKDIVKANSNLKPERMRAGDKLIIPNVSNKTSLKEISSDKVDATKSIPSNTATEPVSTRTYKVRYGDTLELIAEEQLGSSSRWKEILQVNKDKLRGDPKRLRANSVIRLPNK
jgi:nucleoid-associated protein YgaU